MAAKTKADTYPKYWVVHDTGRPLRQLTRRSTIEAATNTAAGWEPFADLEAWLEDSQRIDESQLEGAIEEWKT